MAESALAASLTLEGFLEWEERQEPRYELAGGVVRMMAGGTEDHDRIAIKIISALDRRLRGTPCSVHGSNLKVLSRATGASMYPDAFVRCGRRGVDRTKVDDPVVVFEVLSPGTVKYDLTRKRAEYEAIPSLRRIVFVSPSKAHLDVEVRDAEDRWQDAEVTGLKAVLDLPELGIELPLAEIYEESGVADDEGDDLPVIY